MPPDSSHFSQNNIFWKKQHYKKWCWVTKQVLVCTIWWVKSDLLFDQKEHFLYFWTTFQLLTSRWPTFCPFFAYGLVVVHFNFWVGERNPDIQSKGAQNLLGNWFWFFTVSLCLHGNAFNLHLSAAAASKKKLRSKRLWLFFRSGFSWL